MDGKDGVRMGEGERRMGEGGREENGGEKCRGKISQARSRNE